MFPRAVNLAIVAGKRAWILSADHLPFLKVHTSPRFAFQPLKTLGQPALFAGT